MESNTPGTHRRQAIGAFAHELRTPLTAIKMVIELGRRAGSDGSIVLEPDIAEMFDESLQGLESLADGIQALSWLERGKLRLSPGPCELETAIQRARDLLGADVSLASAGVEGHSGPWDIDLLPECLAAVVEAAARCGDGSARLSAEGGSGGTRVVVESGEPGGAERPINADLGFRFFSACVALEYADAFVECERREHYVRVEVELPG